MSYRVKSIAPYDGKKNRLRLKSQPGRDAEGRGFRRVTYLYLDGSGGYVVKEYLSD